MTRKGRRARVSLAAAARESSRSSRPSRWSARSICRSRTRPASPSRASRSHADEDKSLGVHRARQPRRGDLERHRGARPRRHRPRRRQAGDGGQGLPVQEVRRHRRVRSRGRREGRRQVLSTSSPRSSRRSAASTSRTSRRRRASRSRRSCASACGSRCSTTTSTAPRSSRAPACSTPPSSPDKKLDDIKLVVSGAGAARDRVRRVLLQPRHDGARTSCSSTRKGVVHHGRTDLNRQKQKFAIADDGRRTLADAMRGADMFMGLSVAEHRHARDAEDDGRAADHLRAREPRSRDLVPRRDRGAPRRARRDRPLATSRTRSTTSSASRTSSAARSTAARPACPRR